MTPDHFRASLDLLHWSQRGLAAVLHVDERQVRRWAAGAAIPERIADWLERLATFHASNPPPAASTGVVDLMAGVLADSWGATSVFVPRNCGIPKSEVSGRMRCRYCGAPKVFDQDGMPEPHCYCARSRDAT